MNVDGAIRFLVVDDQASIRQLCVSIASASGFRCVEAESAEAALACLEEHAPDIVLADLRMQSMSGLDLLTETRRLLPHAEVAIMTGFGTIETAVEAMKLGASDYITKPFRVEELRLVLQRMAERVALVAENKFLRERVNMEMELHGIIGSSPQIQTVLHLISRLKDTNTPVLITGESGTGKELVARAIHFRGALAQRPFVAVDCGSLAPTLVESELFGYEKGAFTGAFKTKEGLFEAANGGTIFLDEVGELPLEMQTTLLRVLQEREVRRLGSTQSRRINVRVIAASNRDLEKAWQEGAFRKDLYFRLNVVGVNLPPLRERKADIPMLLQWFLDRHAPGAVVEFHPDAMRVLLAHDWPGNVRELENCVEHAVALRNGDIIQRGDLPAALQSPLAVAETSALPPTQLDDLERVTIERVFAQVNGDKHLALKMLGISRATLYRKLKRYKIPAHSPSMAPN